MSSLVTRNPRSYLILLNILLAIVLLVEIIFQILVFPQVAISKIQVESDLPISKENVLKLLGFEEAPHYYAVDPLAIEARIKDFALVSSVRVTKIFPDTLNIQIETRKPVIAILQEGPESSIPILIDREGVMFQVGMGPYKDVPLLSGIRLSSSNPLHSRIPKAILPLIRSIAKLQDESPKLYQLISEIRANILLTSLETDIYLNNHSSYIKTQGIVDAYTLNTALVALNVLQRSKESTDYIDMRTTGIVYRSNTGNPIPLTVPGDSGGQVAPVQGSNARLTSRDN